MKYTKQPILYYSGLPSRKLTLKEEESIVNWLMEHLDLEHSSACGVLDASFVAAFPPHKDFLLKYDVTTIMLMNGPRAFRFVVQKDGTLELRDEYKSV